MTVVVALALFMVFIQGTLCEFLCLCLQKFIGKPYTVSRKFLESVCRGATKFTMKSSVPIDICFLLKKVRKTGDGEWKESLRRIIRPDSRADGRRSISGYGRT